MHELVCTSIIHVPELDKCIANTGMSGSHRLVSASCRGSIRSWWLTTLCICLGFEQKATPYIPPASFPYATSASTTPPASFPAFLTGSRVGPVCIARGRDMGGGGGGGKGGLSPPPPPPTFKSRGAEPHQNNRLDGTIPRNLALTYSYVTSFLGGWRL